MVSRDASIAGLRAGPLDVLVIGGGINGAGIIRDLALRDTGHALRFALVEREHFSSGTSGRNSQLIHGGLRYLKNLEFHLVSEALSERAILLRIAPHLVRPLPFLIPLHDAYSAVFYEAGLFLYDTLAGGDRIARFRHLKRKELRKLEPRMRAFWGAARFFDCRVNSARLVLLNIREAAANGATAVNYLSVQKLAKHSGMWCVDLLDELCGKRFSIEARTVVDATGAWSRENNLRLVRGSHLVFPRLMKSENAVAHFNPDGRVVFFIPWGPGGELTLVGTTDVDHSGSVDDVHISNEEIGYLRAVVEEVFPGGSGEPIGSYSSLRPLVRDESASATRTSREHRIWADDRGMVHVSGGKYTTYRKMSEEAVDLLCRVNFPELAAERVTAETPILGNRPDEILALLSSISAGDVVHDYGVDTPALLRLVPDVAPAGLTGLEAAQISFGVANECVERLADLLFVSTYWGYQRRWTRELLRPYAMEVGAHKGWDAGRMESEINSVMSRVNSTL